MRSVADEAALPLLHEIQPSATSKAGICFYEPHQMSRVQPRCKILPSETAKVAIRQLEEMSRTGFLCGGYVFKCADGKMVVKIDVLQERPTGCRGQSDAFPTAELLSSNAATIM